MKKALSTFDWVVYSKFLLFLVSLLVAGRGTPSRAWDGHLSNTQKWIVWEDTHADKARDFTGKGCLGGEQQGKGTRGTCPATWLAVLGLMVTGLVSGLSLAKHSDSGYSLMVCASLSQDGFQQGGFWEVSRTYGLASHFDLSWILPVSKYSLLLPHSLQDLLFKIR